MLLKNIIKAPKEVTSVGQWESGKLMPRSAFPLKGKIKIRRVYTWKIIEFNALGIKFKLLIFFRIDKEEYGAWLAIATDPVTLIAKYEYHATHPGWHIHACAESSNAPRGRTSGHFVRMPGPHSYHRNLEFGIKSDQDAQNIAIQAFWLDRKFDDLFGSFR